MTRASTPRTRATAFVVFLAIIAACPLAWRAVLHAWGPAESSLTPSYLPALETARSRYPFDPGPLEEVRSQRPGIVVLGDSMALRVDPDLLGRLTGQRVVSLMRFATGSAHWYLRLKNYVVASGVRPLTVVVFFRDTQLTEPLFRLTGRDRFSADREALDLEPELNTVVEANTGNAWFRLHSWLDRTFAVERARDWLEPKLTNWAGRRVAGAGREDFVNDMNAAFGLDHLRPFEAADMAAAADDKAMVLSAHVGTSTLPLMKDIAERHGITLCFVRVLRRPERGQPPRESPALRRYVRDLRDYLESDHKIFLDDRDEPVLATMKYDDGDHILDEEIPRYTEIFATRLMKALP